MYTYILDKHACTYLTMRKSHGWVCFYVYSAFHIHAYIARVSTHMHVAMCSERIILPYAKGIVESEGHCYVGIFLHSLYIAVLPVDNSTP